MPVSNREEVPAPAKAAERPAVPNKAEKADTPAPSLCRAVSAPPKATEQPKAGVTAAAKKPEKAEVPAMNLAMTSPKESEKKPKAGLTVAEKPNLPKEASKTAPVAATISPSEASRRPRCADSLIPALKENDELDFFVSEEHFAASLPSAFCAMLLNEESFEFTGKTLSLLAPDSPAGAPKPGDWVLAKQDEVQNRGLVLATRGDLVKVALLDAGYVAKVDRKEVYDMPAEARDSKPAYALW